MSTTITFVGDIMLGRFVAKKFEAKPYQIVHHSLVQSIRNTDYVVANLESPITKTVDKQKDHLVFQGTPEMLEQFKWVDCMSLSNNHINDCHEIGMDETVSILNDTQMDWNGLYSSDYKPYLIETRDKIAVITCTDMMNNEFSKDSKWKTIRIENPILTKIIKEYKQKGFYVILYAHVGILFTRFPNPSIREFSHNRIDDGVDLMVTVHPHVLGGMEEYKGKHIFYSLGDFVMDGSSFRRRVSGILKVKIDQGALSKWELEIAQIESNLETHHASPRVKKKAIKSFYYVSRKLNQNRVNYHRFYKSQYRLEMMQHSMSTLHFLFKSKGVLGLFKILYFRLDSVKTMFKRMITDRSKWRYDTDAINKNKSLSSDKIE